MKAFEYTYKTDVVSTDSEKRVLGTSKTTVRYFEESGHFEVIRVYIHDRSEFNSSYDRVLRSGIDYQVCENRFAFSSESILKFLPFIVEMLDD